MKIGAFAMDAATLVGPLESRLAAIRSSGFSQVMLQAGDVAAHPGGIDAVAAAVRAAGLRVTGLQLLRDFEGLSGKLHDYKVDVAKTMLSMCGSLGCKLLLASSSVSDHAATEPDILARDLRKLAMLALPHGIRVAYQALPWGRAVKDLAAAWEVVGLADIPNLGVVIDSFHMLASRTSLDELDMIEPWKIFLVTLSDFMWQDTGTDAERIATARNLRVFPGDGVHSDELARLVKRIDGLGYRGDYCLEVFNEDYQQMPATIVTEHGRRSALWLAEDVLQRSGAPVQPRTQPPAQRGRVT